MLSQFLVHSKVIQSYHIYIYVYIYAHSFFIMIYHKRLDIVLCAIVGPHCFIIVFILVSCDVL